MVALAQIREPLAEGIAKHIKKKHGRRRSLSSWSAATFNPSKVAKPASK
jgi:type IV secretory pathway VirB3-like protein